MGLKFGSTSLADIDQADGPGLHVDPTQFFPIDQAEAEAADQYSPNPASGLPWWQQTLVYGAGRWIDNGFTTKPRIGNFDTGGGAGNNGRTYTNRSGVKPQLAGVGGLGNVSPLLLIGGAVVVGFLLLRG